MTDHNSLLALYRDMAGSSVARVPGSIQHDTNEFECRIVREYSYIPDYLKE